ncbi:hypothetical protein WJX82_004688 [Trebouxia sp. C0006]
MLGFGTLDLRSCTLTRHLPATAPSPQFRLEASFSRAAQVTGSNRVARTASVFRYGSTVGEQLQALAVRPGKSFSGGLRFKPKNLGVNFSDLKKQVLPNGAEFKPETYLSRLHQMKEHLQGVISSLVLIDDIHLHVLKAEGPHVQNRHSDDVHKAIDKVQAAAHTTFNSIVERQVSVEKSRQESQLAARFKSVLSAQTALAQRLAHWRTQDPSSSHGPTDSTQVASHEDGGLDGEWELMAASAMLHHMPPSQAVDQATLLVAELLPCMEGSAMLRAAVQSFSDLCRRHLDELLEGLTNWTQDAASATAATNTACLLQLTKAFAETQAALVRQALPLQFGNVVADAGQQCTALCAGCACQQVQVIILRLATSDLFVEQPASASGTHGGKKTCSKAQDSAQQLHTAKGSANENEVSDMGGKAMSGSCTLLMLLSKCTQMEGLLARLVPAFLAVLSFEGPQQDREGHALQIEGDLTFQRGQVQQSYIGTVCAQLQRHIGNYLAPASAWQAVPHGVGEGAVHLVLTLVAVQADMLRLAPHSCVMQVMRMVVKQAVMEWHEQVQPILADAGLCAALQLSLDLHYLEASLVAYTTPATARLLHTCHSTLSQAVTHCLCNNDAQCTSVQQVYGDHLSYQSAAAWLDKLGKQAVEAALTYCSYNSACLVDGAAVGLAATSGKYGRQNAGPGTPRSPAIKAFHHSSHQQSFISPEWPGSTAAESHGNDGADSSHASSPPSQHPSSKISRLGTSRISGVALSSNSRTGSIVPKERHSRHKPPKLQAQFSISLSAMAALNRPPPLQIPP